MQSTPNVANNIRSKEDSSVTPKFSIINPTFKCKSKLEATAKSILSQSFTDFEYWIIDGGSTDGTVEAAEALGDARVKVVSERDKGVYDAMNKGIEGAKGKYLYFIGAGDELVPGALERVAPHLPKKGPTVAYGNVSWDKKIYAGKFSKRELCRKNICHQAIFYEREVFQMLGHYDLKYKFFADYEFNMKCFGTGGIEIVYIPETIAIYEGGGISETGDPLFTADKLSLIRRHLGLCLYLRAIAGNQKQRLFAKLGKAKHS